MERITQSNLEGLLKRINAKAGFITVDGKGPKYSEVGSYTLDYAYGGVRLDQFVNESGGIKTITNDYVPKRKLWELMHAFLMGMETK